MQDRFKFRIWDKSTKTFIGMHSKLPNLVSPRLVCDKGIIDIIDIENSHKYFDIQQCTGLKDKNGKLIYEGDICNVDNYKRPSIVQRNALGFELYCKPSNIPGYHFDKFFPIDEMEIIGNIYENPEILKDEG